MLNNQKEDPQRQESAGRVEIPAELVAEAKAGDQAAFTELFDLTHRAIYRTIRSMVRDEDLVWDIHQDTYLRAFKGLDKLENEASFFPWLRRIAVNVTAKTMAKRVPLPFSELGGEEDVAPELPDPNPETQPELALDRKETSRMVREILSSLPEAQQMIVGMRYYEELPVEEIAALLGVTQGTVKTQLHRGRKRIETAVRELERRGVKLYGLSPLPFLMALLRRLEPAEAAEKQAAAALAKSGVKTVGVRVGRRFVETAAGRLLLGLLTVGVIGGGIASWRWLQSRAEPLGDVRPPVIRMASPEDMSSEPTILMSAATEPAATEPETTEPATTEASTTEPETTEPVTTEQSAIPTEAQPAPVPPQPTEPKPTEHPEPTPSETPATEAEEGLTLLNPAGDAVIERWEATNYNNGSVYGEATETYTFRDLPWGSPIVLQVHTSKVNGTIPKPQAYSDNTAVAEITSSSSFDGAGSSGWSIWVESKGSGIAHITVDYGGGNKLCFTIDNPVYSEKIIRAWAEVEARDAGGITDGFENCCSDAYFRIYVMVQGWTAPEITTDNPAVVPIAYVGEYYDGSTTWIKRGYMVSGTLTGAGDAHIYVGLNGKIEKMWTVHATDKNLS